MNTSSGKNLVKPDVPEKYNRESKDPAVLLRWGRAVVTYLMMGNVQPDSYLALRYILSCVSGKAMIWYDKHVLGPSHQSRPLTDPATTPSKWPFHRLLQEFDKRFASKTFFRNAEYKWRRISQKDEDGTMLSVTDVGLAIEETADQRYMTSELEMKISLSKH